MPQFSLPLLSTVVLTMAIRERGGKKAEEGSDEAGVCAPPPHLTHTHTLSTPPPPPA